MNKMKTIFSQQKKYSLFFRDCFSIFFFFGKTTLFHGKLNKES